MNDTKQLRTVAVRLPAAEADAAKARAKSVKRTVPAHIRWLLEQDLATACATSPGKWEKDVNFG
jgi:hypothetical protein